MDMFSRIETLRFVLDSIGNFHCRFVCWSKLLIYREKCLKIKHALNLYQYLYSLLNFHEVNSKGVKKKSLIYYRNKIIFEQRKKTTKRSNSRQ